MSSRSAPTLAGKAVFEPLITLAKARTVALVESGGLAAGDGEFLLRALFDLESDGVELFGPGRLADGAFYGEIEQYLAARVGPLDATTPVLVPAGAEAIAAAPVGEGRRIAEVLGLPDAVPWRPTLDRAVLELVSHEGGKRVNHKFLVHRRGDHVGVAVVDIEPGEHVQGVFMDDDSTIEIDVRERVPLGHKVAIAALDQDAEVLEYGIPIGRASASYEVGTYVHTHNLRSARW